MRIPDSPGESLAAPPAPEPADDELAEARQDLRLWLRLLACSTLIQRQIRRGLRREFATTLPRFDLLAQLQRAPEGLTMGELSTRMMVTNGNVTGLAERLVREGLVRRIRAVDDRRRQTLALTPQGSAALQRMTPAHAAWIDGIMAGLSAGEKQDLLALLTRLKRSAESYENGVQE